MMRKFFCFGALLAIGTIGNSVWADNYHCTGAMLCPECNGGYPSVGCTLSGSHDGPTRCEISAAITEVTCTVYSGNDVVDSTTRECPTCNTGGGGGTGGGGSGGQCDPTLPLWWVFCDPWAMNPS